MSLKAELEIWQSALQAAEASPPDLPLAISLFGKIGDTSKIEWNIGILLAVSGDHLAAIERYRRATELDDWLVIGWFQSGVSRYLLGQYDGAYRDFDAAHSRMRGNATINYTQLGLAHTIHSAEILFNRGLSLIKQNQTTRGLADLVTAGEVTTESTHVMVHDAIRDMGRGYNPYCVPTGLMFEPSQGKLKNLKPRDYMGKAVLVAATSPSDAYTTFTGVTQLNRGQTPTGVPLPRAHPLARSASVNNLRPFRSDSIGLAPAASMSRFSRTRFASMDETSPGPGSNFVIRPIESTSPLLPYLPILHPQTPPRKAPAPPGLTRLVIPSPSFPSNLPRTPDEQVTELINEYYSPDTDLGDAPNFNIRHRDRSDSISKWEKEGLDKRYASPLRTSPSPPSSFMQKPAAGPTFGLGRSGSMVSSRNALGLRRQGSVSSSLRFEEEWEMSKIRVKVHISGHTRAMSLPANAVFSDVHTSLRAKFPQMSSGECNLLFKDEDGDMLSMVDEGDWEAGVDVARVMGGKLEIWVE